MTTRSSGLGERRARRGLGDRSLDDEASRRALELPADVRREGRVGRDAVLGVARPDDLHALRDAVLAVAAEALDDEVGALAGQRCGVGGTRGEHVAADGDALERAR